MRLAGFLRFALSFAVLLILPQLASADEVMVVDKVFAEMKDKCQKKYEKLFLGTTADMTNGTYAYSECLGAHINNLADRIFRSNVEVEKFKTAFNAVVTNYYEIMSSAYQGNRACNISCGTMYIPISKRAVSSIYEETLKHFLFISYDHFGLPASEPLPTEYDRDFSADKLTKIDRYLDDNFSINGKNISAQCVADLINDNEYKKKFVSIKDCFVSVKNKGEICDESQEKNCYRFLKTANNEYLVFYERRKSEKVQTYIATLAEIGSVSEKQLRLARIIDQGAGCDGGISDVTISGDKLSYKSNVTAESFFYLFNYMPSDIDYKNCFAAVDYKLDTKDFIPEVSSAKIMESALSANPSGNIEGCMFKTMRKYGEESGYFASWKQMQSWWDDARQLCGLPH